MIIMSQGLKHLHVAEHADHDDHADTAQSTTHSCVLHAVVLVSAGQAAPPLAGLVMMVRECVCVGGAAPLALWIRGQRSDAIKVARMCGMRCL